MSNPRHDAIDAKWRAGMYGTSVEAQLNAIKMEQLIKVQEDLRPKEPRQLDPHSTSYNLFVMLVALPIFLTVWYFWVN